MPLERFYKLPEARRAELLRIALHEFTEKGIEGASLNAILAKAGLSKGAYYYYFVDKEDLFTAVAEDMYDRLEAQLPPLLPQQPVSAEEFWPSLEQTFSAWLVAASKFPELLGAFRQLSQQLRASPRLAPMLRRRQEEQFRSVIQLGRKLGCVRTDLPVELLVSLMVVSDSVLDEALVASRKTLSEAVVRKHARVVFDTYQRLLCP
ncbi:Transcriptional regulator, TetR family [Cystobacter fuscus DSM 2262]|uniref:Transcriptional regulator, TetR family n=1 Tax=Cystobacter fuscus (strain ATCC 25194 / DSM 2262 / NBRC 100088 / M29) TaxID=1242864 RepID=S9PLN5_CYSF2|nr:TetR/AcrR family transcriptional regulator [Cystobacter fuscus]EPX63936.1 Transcriptional regulator, TetR family [Cystobacter fuscus DSM 2262]